MLTVALFFLTDIVKVGVVRSVEPLTLMGSIYFSAETYTSLGFGDVTPEGHSG
jgi:Ion channel